MALSEHPLLCRVVVAADEYRARSRTAAELQRVLSEVMSAVESDVPKPIRDALFEAEARIDSARFTIDVADQPAEISKVLDELASVIQAADAPL